jgi:hypothetical protein
MEGLIALWIPILLAAIVMFFASSIAWMLLPFHKHDWAKLPDQAAAMNALAGVEPGQYLAPHGDMNAPWFASILVQRRVNMGTRLTLWFLNQLLIAALTAYLIYYALPPEAEYLLVFRIAGTALVLGQIGALFARAIWWGWKWNVVLVEAVEGVVYALLAAGVFGWWWVR